MAKAKEAKETPLMKQYNAMKAKYPGALLLFRVGDFYETFEEDAIKASQILDIVLTKRSNGAASQVELAGFPHHALDSYLPKLVRSGLRVAICDQLEDPKIAKGIVKRGVTELVTPGVSLNDNVLEKRKNNFLASVHYWQNQVGISFLDISTGEFLVSQGTVEYVDKLIQGFNPAEVILSKDSREIFIEDFDDELNTFGLDNWVYKPEYGYEKLIRHFNTSSLKGFGIEHLKSAITAAGATLHYLEETEHRNIQHIASIARIDEESYVWLDRFTIRNLELIHPQQEGGVPLIHVMDETITPMGARLLKKWMVMPLKELEEIRKRQGVVYAFIENESINEEIKQNLKPIGDLERLISKVAVKRISPREIVQLKKALEKIAPIQDLLLNSGLESLEQLGHKLDTCDFIKERIHTEIAEDPPVVANQGNIIRNNVHEELDELRKIAYSGKDVLVQIQKREQEKTGIPSLKIAYNKVFGYYLEVTNAHKDKVPAEWVRKQTLVNAERYITEELKGYEEKILNAEEKMIVLEQQLFNELVAAACEFVTPIQENARVLAQIDCLSNFASIADHYKYARPEVNDSFLIDIKKGRHAVIERQLPVGEAYIPNDVFLDNEKQQILIITGPNMSGKSALLRQTALIVLLAQMGSYVPAESARIGVVDKVFTRVGASDNLARGESTFMVEMIETASILNNLSDRSLILMDEIGRGTSTYDGVSIAWSIVEYLHNHPQSRPKTLFATHYHELNQLEEDLPRLKNFNVSVKEVGDKVIFLRKLIPGGSEHSFGIHVAQMAGMPNKVVIRSNEILHFLEKDKKKNGQQERLEQIPKADYQLMLFENDPRFKEISQKLEAIDINTISPVEALLKLNELQKLLQENEK